MIMDAISIAGVTISVCLAFYIRHLDKQQRKRDEGFYVTVTIRNVQQLQKHMINIQAISEQSDDYDNEEQVETTQELAQYAKRNNDIIDRLISDTRFSMSRWMSLETVERSHIEKLVETASWIMQNYLPRPCESEGTQRRRWSTQLEDFQKRKSDSSRKIDELLLKYS